jgi:hypothetical protein
VVLTNKAGGGQLRFSGATDTKKTLSVPANGAWVPFDISGETESAAIGDAAIEAHLDNEKGALLGSKGATVLWVSYDPPKGGLDAAGPIPADNSAGPAFAAIFGPRNLGIYTVHPRAFAVYQSRGGVNPAAFPNPIVTKRNIRNGAYYRGQNVAAPGAPANWQYELATGIATEADDTDSTHCQDQLAEPNGRIYTLDAPGARFAPVAPWTRLVMRINFRTWAEFRGVRVSDDMLHFSRLAVDDVVDNAGRHTYQLVPLMQGDNLSQLGTTRITVDGQPDPNPISVSLTAAPTQIPMGAATNVTFTINVAGHGGNNYNYTLVFGDGTMRPPAVSNQAQVQIQPPHPYTPPNAVYPDQGALGRFAPYVIVTQGAKIAGDRTFITYANRPHAVANSIAPGQNEAARASGAGSTDGGQPPLRYSWQIYELDGNGNTVLTCDGGADTECGIGLPIIRPGVVQVLFVLTVTNNNGQGASDAAAVVVNLPPP